MRYNYISLVSGIRRVGQYRSTSAGIHNVIYQTLKKACLLPEGEGGGHPTPFDI